MFDFGWGELVVIGIVALIAIGPKELPTSCARSASGSARSAAWPTNSRASSRKPARGRTRRPARSTPRTWPARSPAFANIDPLAEEQRQIERIGEGAGNLPSDAVMTGPTATTAEPAAALPDISVLPPQLPPPPSEKDFAAAEPAPTKRAPKSAVKTASSSPKRKPKSRPGGGAHERRGRIEATKAPLMDHLIELRSRLIKALIAFAIMFILCFFFAKHIYNVLVWPFVWVAGPENSQVHLHRAARIFHHPVEAGHVRRGVSVVSGGGGAALHVRRARPLPQRAQGVPAVSDRHAGLLHARRDGRLFPRVPDADPLLAAHAAAGRRRPTLRSCCCRRSANICR